MEKFDVNICNLVYPSIECRVKLSRHVEGEKADQIQYKSWVRSLCYLTCTRHDISLDIVIVIVVGPKT